MNAEVKAEWVLRLRSGRYRQGKIDLHRSIHGSDRYDVLGVLCEIAYERGIVDRKLYSTTYLYGHEGTWAMSCLPIEVERWAEVNHVGQLPDGRELMFLSDDGVPFAELADIIEREL